MGSTGFKKFPQWGKERFVVGTAANVMLQGDLVRKDLKSGLWVDATDDNYEGVATEYAVGGKLFTIRLKYT